MNVAVRHHLAVLAFAVPLVFGAAAPVQPAFADSLTDAQAKQGQLNAQIARDKAQLAQVRGQQAETQAQLNLLTDQITQAEANLANQNAKLDAILGQIDQAQRDLAAKKVEEAQRQDLLNRRMRGLYKQNGATSFLDALFSASNFSELVDRFMVMRDITRSDELLLQQIQQDRAAIEALNAQLAQKRDQQAATVAAIRDQTGALQAQYVKLGVLKAQLASEVVSIEQQQQRAQAALAQVNSEIAALVAARSRAHSSGVFAWPGVQGPISQPFGCTDFQGEPPPPSGYSCPPREPYFHTGIDIAGPYGSEIDSADGGIAYTYPGNTGYGNHIIVVHANGFVTLYGHMSSFAVSDAQGVGKGQRIGYEGSTGFSSGPHLHFEIRLNNQPVNPCNYVGC
jgi:murein DD-endopeptidase MepM/ murein hydrolase activator NlpD